jgi:hypothetical protein
MTVAISDFSDDFCAIDGSADESGHILSGLAPVSA